MARSFPLAPLAATLATVLAAPAVAGDAGAEFALRGDARGAAVQGPLADANALAPDRVAQPASALASQAEGFAVLRPARSLSLTGRVRLTHEETAGGARSRGELLEAHAALDGGDTLLSIGRKVLGWDVGWGWRPNDVVQQEPRRTLLAQAPQGRPIVQIEGFDADRAWSLVAVNPHHARRSADDARGADEAALAARGWWRVGALDLHGFARHGRHTGASLGAAAAWVATDELALHASVRAAERFDRWRFDDGATTPSPVRPWRLATGSGGAQALVGAQWTHAAGVGVLVEAWHDGQALADSEWRDWLARNRALRALAADPRWRAAAAGNLAWQAEPLAVPNLRRETLLARLSWTAADWGASFDALVTPADRGRVLTAALQLKGERWRFDLAWRQLGGPDAALFSLVPVRRSLLAAATLAI